MERLLIYAQSNEHLFRDSVVGYGVSGRIDHTHRRSIVLPKLGDLKSEVKARVRDLLPAIFERLGTTPFTPTFELELVAHGDGAFFSRHIDTATQKIDTSTQKEGLSNRIISAVYYFHTLPKAFTGGVLRLHSVATSDQQRTFVDIEPDYDTLVFFPSWFPHEVQPVKCPSGRFLDSRFAINIWIHRSLQPSPH